ncbi:MAG TPA: MarR family transcriptional regulator [Stellaceae bacterium]|nr:MarR family transcriptional regulator [Stellaceae bacterium]
MSGMEMERVLHIGIASRAEMRRRTLDIVSGKYKPTPNDPRVWFTSLESFAQVLSSDNRLVLEIIRRSKPTSMSELAKLCGREVSNLSRTLHTMAKYGLVSLTKVANENRIVPEVHYDRVALEVALAA